MNEKFPPLQLKHWIDRFDLEEGPNRRFYGREKKYFQFWREKLGEKIAIDLTPFEIESVADSLMSTLTKNGTSYSFESRRKFLLYLSSLYGFAIRKWKWAESNPLKMVNMKPCRKPKESCSFEEPHPLMKEIQERIQSYLDKRGMNHREASDHCGVAKSTFQQLMSKRSNPNLFVLLKVIKSFNLKLEVYEH